MFGYKGFTKVTTNLFEFNIIIYSNIYWYEYQSVQQYNEADVLLRFLVE